MKKTHSALLTSLVSLAVIGGCASTTPTSPVASSSQSGSGTQSTVAATSTANTSPVSTVQTSASMVKPTASTVYFEFDSYTVSNQYANVVRSNADYLSNASVALELDGNADERGSREYNMALGQKRAEAVKRAMTALGAKAERIETISFGEDKPKSTGRDEAAWAENRRVDFVSKAK